MFTVYHIVSGHVAKRVSLESSAKRSTTVLNKKARLAGEVEDQFAYMPTEAFNTIIDIEVDTYNCLDPERKPIKIRRSQKDIPYLDPAYETYHCM